MQPVSLGTFWVLELEGAPGIALANPRSDGAEYESHISFESTHFCYFYSLLGHGVG